MFGQIHYQDDVSRFYVKDLLDRIRDYAEFRGVEIVIGAQTNDIDDEKIFKSFLILLKGEWELMRMEKLRTVLVFQGGGKRKEIGVGLCCGMKISKRKPIMCLFI